MEKDLGSMPRTDKCVVGALINFQKGCAWKHLPRKGGDVMTQLIFL